MSRWGLLLSAILILLVPAPARGLVVGGVIDVDTTWTIADSPVQVSADLLIEANLTVDPGVQVRFASGVELVLGYGAIRAVGTQTAPIVFDSGLAIPAPGDWGPLRITNTSADGQTEFDWVVIRHGTGMVLQAASPTLNRVAFENHAGAAITMDLLSSPVGVGLSATGNGLNGIAIPAGVIDRDVRWGLVGIPYVVAEGIVTVGLPPMTMLPLTREIHEGQQTTFILQLAKPAPTGGLAMDVVSSAPGTVSVTSPLIVPAGDTTAQVSVSGIRVGFATVTVSRLELGAVSAAVTVRPQSTIELVPGNATLAVGQTGTFQARLNEPSPAGGVMLALSSSVPTVATVPATAFIPQGHTSTSFAVQALALGNTNVSASAAGYIGASAGVTVSEQFLSFSPIGVLQPNRSHSITVNISAPAPATGITVNLSSGPSSVLIAPPTAFIAAGATSASFIVQAGVEGSATLNASKLGYEPASAVVTVQLIQLSFDPGGGTARIPVNGTDHFIVRLNRPAMAGGLPVTITGSGGMPPTLSVTPTEVVIPQGQTASPTPVAVTGLRTGFGTVYAESPGVLGASRDVELEAAARMRFEPGSMSLGRGTVTLVALNRLWANGSAYFDRDAATVSLVSSDPQRLPVPPSITIPADASMVWLELTPTSAALAPDAVTISAESAGLDNATMSVSISDPSIVFDGLDGLRPVGGDRDEFSVVIAPAGYAVPLQDLVVDLAIDEPTPPGVVDGLFDSGEDGGPLTQLTIPAGSPSSAVPGYVGSPTEAGQYRLSARVGTSEPDYSGEQIVSDAIGLQFSTTQVRLVPGMRVDPESVRVYRALEGSEFPGQLPLPVTLSFSEPGKVHVPGPVTIPARESGVGLALTGLELTTAPVLVEASAAGFASPPEPISVTVEPATISLSVNTSLQVGDPRSPFSINWEYNPKGSQLVSPVDRVVSVSIVDQTPPGIVDGLFAAAIGSEPIGPLQLRTGDFQVTNAQGEPAQVFVGSPLGAGTFRIHVDVPEFGSWNSDVITVAAAPDASVSFSRSNVVVGRGLRTREVTIRRVGGELAQAQTIELVSAEPGVVSVLETVVIPGGQTDVAVPLSGLSLSAAAVTISAQVQGDPSLAASMTATVVDPTVVARFLQNQRSVGDERDAFTVSWDVPGSFGSRQASLADTTVSLAIADSPIGMIDGIYASAAGPNQRSTLTIRAGATDATTPTGEIDQLYIGSPSMTGTYRIRASVSGLADSLSGVQSVAAPRLVFTKASQVVGLGLRTGEVRLRRLSAGGASAPVATDLTINLSCAAFAVCTVPATITMPAGSSEIEVPVVGTGVGATRLVAAATGHLAGTPADVDVRVVQPRLVLVNAPRFLRVGESAMPAVRLEVPGSTSSVQTTAAALQITLTSSFPTVAGVSAAVVIPAGSAQSNHATLQAISAGRSTLAPSATIGLGEAVDMWITE